MTALAIGRVEEFEDPGRRVVAHAGVEIGIFRVGDRFTAFRNLCPHLGGPVCRGRLMPRVVERLDDERRLQGLAFDTTHMQIVCPWHGWEFDIATGRHQVDPAMRLSPVPVRVEDGVVLLDLGGPR
jgi:nitrite reductase/ring-hydroxylating ferredoxin subunit